jgi:hypothetical protein
MHIGGTVSSDSFGGGMDSAIHILSVPLPHTNECTMLVA